MTFKAPTGAGQHTYSDIYANALWEMLRVGGSKKPMEDLLTRALRGYDWIEQAVPSPYRGTVIQGLPAAITIHTVPHDPDVKWVAYEPALNVDPGK